MPDLLTTRQLAEYLQLSERSVYRLLERGELPAARVGGQWRFRKSAVDAWLAQGGAATSEDLGDDVHPSDRAARRASVPETSGMLTHPGPAVSELLSAANILLDLAAGSRDEVLTTLVERLVSPEPLDRELLLSRLREREDLCSTAIADGIAMPHTPRTRERVLRRHDLVAIARTQTPVAFGALDGNPTGVFVLVLAQDERAHLVLLAKVARLIREPSVRTTLRTGDAAAIIDRVRRTEAALFEPEPGE